MCNSACGNAKMKLFRNKLEEFKCDTITTFTALMKKLLIILFGTAVNFKSDCVLDYDEVMLNVLGCRLTY